MLPRLAPQLELSTHVATETWLRMNQQVSFPRVIELVDLG
jgi:hypothetical protein